MNGAAKNLQPFESALERLNEGKSADHTATTVYQESIWPIIDKKGRKTQLVWPDYGGEQVKAMLTTRRVPKAWRTRIEESQSWILLIRLNSTQVGEDVLSRPLGVLQKRSSEVSNRSAPIQLSDQARLIELLQMLLHIRHTSAELAVDHPRLAVLLTCWDELGAPDKPRKTLRSRLPMFSSFVDSNWNEPLVLGLSALGRALSDKTSDHEYAARGPEQFGFIVKSDGTHSPDLTLPIAILVSDPDEIV